MHRINTNSFHSRLTDLMALTVSFVLFAFATQHYHSYGMLLDVVTYVSVMFFFLRLSKRIVFEYFRIPNRTVRVLLGNFLGFSFGVLVLLTLQSLLPFIVGETMVVIFSSIFAFFILGTLSPMVKSSNMDIIHH